MRVDFSVEVVAVTPGSDDAPKPRVTLSTGEVVTPDLLIGADGPRSLVREAVLGQPDNAEPSELTVYTATIPGDKMRDDPDFRPWLESNEWPIWMGTRRSVCGEWSWSCIGRFQLTQDTQGIRWYVRPMDLLMVDTRS